MTIDRFCRFLAGGALVSLPGWAQVSDNFNDGNDEGWTRLNPLEAVGGSSVFSFPGENSYRIQAGVSPNPEAFGQARLGSLREDLNQTAFRVSLDIVAMDTSLEQDIGILTRVATPGLGTLTGYSSTIDVDVRTLFLSRLDGETPTTIDRIEFDFDGDKDYRMIFQGYEGQFLAEVFELPDLTTPVASASGSDDTYVEGFTGVFGSSGIPTGTVDVTYDNFEAGDDPDTDQDGMSDPEEAAVFGDLDETGEDDFDGDGRSNAEELEQGTDPKVPDSVIEVTGFSLAAETLSIQFEMSEAMTFRLERSNDLKDWTVDEDAVFTDLGDGVGEFVVERQGAPEFVRVSEVKN